jgi:hypothetical protein
MSKSHNRILALIIVVVAAAAALVLAITSNQQSAKFEPDSPEAAVQSFLIAMFDGDTDQAAKFLAASSPCDVNHLDRAWVQRNANIDLVRVDISGSTARVEVNVEIGNSDLFNQTYIESHNYRLEKTGDSWLITGIPWPVYDCGVISK